MQGVAVQGETISKKIKFLDAICTEMEIKG